MALIATHRLRENAPAVPMPLNTCPSMPVKPEPMTMQLKQHLREEADPEIGRENVPRRDKYVLPDGDALRRAREEQLDHALRDGLLE